MKNFIVVFIAVILANLSTLTLYELYQQYKVKNQIDMGAFETVDTPVKPTIEPAQLSDAKKAEERRRNEQLTSARSICNYWTNEYDKDPTGLNEALKEKACLRYKKLQSAMPLVE